MILADDARRGRGAGFESGQNNVKNYVGGNTLMEIGFAHVLNQKIFMLNPIPEMPYCKSEIEAVKPVIFKQRFDENTINKLKIFSLKLKTAREGGF